MKAAAISFAVSYVLAFGAVIALSLRHRARRRRCGLCRTQLRLDEEAVCSGCRQQLERLERKAVQLERKAVGNPR
jgi:hypothetical protein